MLVPNLGDLGTYILEDNLGAPRLDATESCGWSRGGIVAHYVLFVPLEAIELEEDGEWSRFELAYGPAILVCKAGRWIAIFFSSRPRRRRPVAESPNCQSDTSDSREKYCVEMPPKGRQGGAKSRRPNNPKGGKPNPRKRPYGQKFDKARLADIEYVPIFPMRPQAIPNLAPRESESDASEEGAPSEEESEIDDDSDDQDEAQNAPSKSYMALMQSFAQESGSKNKRRKLDHGPPKEASTKAQEPEVDAEEVDEEQDIDRVEEPEEGPETEIVPDDDDDEAPDSSDPFESHFSCPDGDEVANRLRALKAEGYVTSNLEVNGWRLTRGLPGKEASSSARPITAMPSPSELKLKQKLSETAAKRPHLDKLEQVLYPITFGYSDLLFCGRTPKNADKLRRMTCLHALNHIFKTRDRVIKNNARLAKEGGNSEFEPRDQGFTRPKVLMLLPTRQSAVHMVKEICSIYPPDQQEHRKRFDDSYIDRESKFSSERPEDYRELFEGNDDDMFRLGVKFTRKTIKYFSQFYNSDILMASPLGLRMAIGSEESKQNKLDYDFLSSIEMVIVDQADALLMQNWEHVEFIFEHLNLQPREAHDCDFSRVREWYLEKQAPNYRQNIILSAFNTPDLQELHRQGENWAGRVRVQPEYAGVLQEMGVKAKQTFTRFEAPSIASEPDARFEYFTSAIVPTLLKRGKDVSGTLIFVPSYLDFVRVRNYFATSPAVASLTFGIISEYADVPEASRARSHFLNGRHKVLLYTERAHHFRRYTLPGVKRVIMYSLPDNPIFYKEIVGGYLGKSEQDLRLQPGQGSVRVVFSKYDVLRLERVVGSKRVGKMIRERGDTFEFI